MKNYAFNCTPVNDAYIDAYSPALQVAVMHLQFICPPQRSSIANSLTTWSLYLSSIPSRPATFFSKKGLVTNVVTFSGVIGDFDVKACITTLLNMHWVLWQTPPPTKSTHRWPCLQHTGPPSWSSGDVHPPASRLQITLGFVPEFTKSLKMLIVKVIIVLGVCTNL